MKKEKIKKSQIFLVGITGRTNNKNEMNPEKAKIGNIVGTYFSGQIANKFHGRVNPGVTYSVFTDYESDEHGEYTYFIGEEVKSLEGQDLSKFKVLTIPAGVYQKFTTHSGKMPDVIIQAWQEIWKMDAHDLGGKRNYIADFEIYDQRAQDPLNTVADIYIGIENK